MVTWCVVQLVTFHWGLPHHGRRRSFRTRTTILTRHCTTGLTPIPHSSACYNPITRALGARCGCDEQVRSTIHMTGCRLWRQLSPNGTAESTNRPRGGRTSCRDPLGPRYRRQFGAVARMFTPRSPTPKVSLFDRSEHPMPCAACELVTPCHY